MSLLYENQHAHFENESLPEGQGSVFDDKILDKNERVVIDASGVKQVFDENDPFPMSILRLTGEKLPLIAQVGLPRRRNREDQFFILDARDSRRYKSPYVVLKEEDEKAVVKGIWPDKTITVGRSSSHENRFRHSEHVSNSHFSLTLEGEAIVLQDLASTNGVEVTGFLVPDEDASIDIMKKHDVRGDFTSRFVEKARNLLAFNDNRGGETPYGTMKGFAVIGRDSPTVRRGVYGTLTPKSEFVIVNDNSPQIMRLEESLIASLREDEHVRRTERSILDAVRVITERTMRYDLEEVGRMSEPYYESSGLIALSDYIDRGVGVCRQQALLAAVLIEGVIEAGYLEGSAHVERNRRIEARGAHAWTVFSGKGEDIIVDPAQHFVGTREEAAAIGRWPYYVDVSRAAES